MRTQLAALLAATTVCIASSASGASAQSPYYYQPQPQPQPTIVYVEQAPQPIGRIHDGGFYGRVQLGGALSYTTYPAADLSWSGGAFDFSLSLGLSLPGSVALHFDVLADVTGGVNVSSGGSTSTSTDTSYATVGFGLGATYYFPRNGFVTGGLGLGRGSLADETGTVIAESDLGVYLTAGAGKEWWLGRRFAIGFYGRLSIFSLPDSGVDDRFTTIVPAAGLSMSID